jgi:hypothetical protein
MVHVTWDKDLCPHLRNTTPDQIACLLLTAPQSDWRPETAGTLAGTHKTEGEMRLERASIVD